jgi:hypothetical protein
MVLGYPGRTLYSEEKPEERQYITRDPANKVGQDMA